MAVESRIGARLAGSLLKVEGAVGVVAWRLGELPVERWTEGEPSPVAGRVIAALTGSLEKGLEDLSMGQLGQIWWQTDEIQCVGFRAGDWQVLVLAKAEVDTGSLRTGVAGVLEKMWEAGNLSGREEPT